MRRIIQLLLGSIAFLSLVSCGYLGGRLWVSMGNYNYDRGNYIEAVSYYNKSITDVTFQPWIYYNLGLTYAALSENESALEMWERARELVDQPFLFYVHYNEGLVFYYQGLYSRAFDSFKHALKINPYDREAKINLELSLDKMRNIGSGTNMVLTGSNRSSQPTSQEQELLEFIKQSEGTPWTINRQVAPASTEPDY